jgi:hypothetical protein
MKTQKSFFQSLCARERALVLNRPLATLLGQAIVEVENISSLSPLQKSYILAETAYVYQHFGFSVFGPTARVFVAEHMSACSGISQELLQTWFELLAFTLLEDFNMLKIVTGEPDWNTVDDSFFGDFAKRILCFENGENADLGLDAWANSIVQTLCERSSAWLSMLPSHSLSHVLKDVRAQFDRSDFSEMLLAALEECLCTVNENPLQIFIWRVQFLTSFSDIRQEAKFFMRADGEEPEARALQMAALLSLLVHHEAENGEVLLPETPLSVNQMASVLKSSYFSTQFDTTLFRNWMRVTDATVVSQLSMLAKECVTAGLLFEVPNGKRGKVYGPTLTALRILEPFQSTVTRAILKTSREVRELVPPVASATTLVERPHGAEPQCLAR